MSTYNADRRKMLRATVLFGLVVAGCQKKEEMPGAPQSPAEPAPGTLPPGPSGAAPGADATPQTGGSEGAASAGAGQGAAAPGGKISQAQAQYQNMPKGDQKCAGCMHFVAESNTCKVVEGTVSPEGWCMLWAKKA